MKHQTIIIGERHITVGEDGTVLNQAGKVLKQYLRNGYPYVEFVTGYKKKRKKFAVHRLVAMAFLPNPMNYPHINHIDGNPKNSHVSNLEWCTPSQNQTHSRYVLNNQTGFTDAPVKCVELGSVYKSTREAWRETGINYCHISECANGKRKTAGGYTWTKAEVG